MSFDEQYPDSPEGFRTRTVDDYPPVYLMDEDRKCSICGTDTKWASHASMAVCSMDHHRELWRQLLQMYAISVILT
jgi:hypothetical protein